MLSSFRQNQYSPVLSDPEHELGDGEATEKPPRGRQFLSPRLLCIAFFTTSILGLSFLSGVLFEYRSLRSPALDHYRYGERCENPSTRREWRTLSAAEKHDYLNAVQCLRDTPSKLHPEYSLYDDFPWIHTRVGNYSNNAAAFLAWHRYFIHSYEKALREDCHYKGSLSYWDWSLDWENITKAPIWDNTLGFGSNGDSDSEGIDSRGIGQCVVDGPFARLSVPFISSKQAPHCLSRAFNTSDTTERLKLQPHILDSWMKIDDYEEFNLGLEDAAHASIPHIVRGDFLMFTAPYDPVFFLHHTQLDRLWWLWQQKDLQNRLYQYRGVAASKSLEKASVKDILLMGNLVSDVRVMDILDTESGVLCYNY